MQCYHQQQNCGRVVAEPQQNRKIALLHAVCRETPAFSSCKYDVCSLAHNMTKVFSETSLHVAL